MNGVLKFVIKKIYKWAEKLFVLYRVQKSKNWWKESLKETETSFLMSQTYVYKVDQMLLRDHVL